MWFQTRLQAALPGWNGPEFINKEVGDDYLTVFGLIDVNVDKWEKLELNHLFPHSDMFPQKHFSYSLNIFFIKIIAFLVLSIHYIHIANKIYNKP